VDNVWWSAPGLKECRNLARLNDTRLIEETQALACDFGAQNNLIHI
jgi:hypothetical protein